MYLYFFYFFLFKHFSVAKTLGSLSVSPTTLEYYKQANPPIINYVVTDQDAVSACVKFAGK